MDDHVEATLTVSKGGDVQHLRFRQDSGDGPPSISGPIGNLILGCNYGTEVFNLAKVVEFVLECAHYQEDAHTEAMYEAAKAIVAKDRALRGKNDNAPN